MIYRALIFLVLCSLPVFSLFAVEANLHYVDSILGLTESCHPQAIKLSLDPILGLSLPKLSGTPLYGKVPLAGESFPVVVVWGEDKPSIYVDLDGSGKLTEFDWERTLSDGSELTSVPFSLSYTKKEESSKYRAFLIWNPDIPMVIVYCRDSYRVGTVQLGKTSYRIALVDANSDGRYDDLNADLLFIDIDQDGKFLTTRDSHELYWLDKPFNIVGTVYQATAVSPDGAEITIDKSDNWVAKKPSLEPGFPAPDFSGVDQQGNKLSLASLKGEIVLVDFWASWCGACLLELPNVEKSADSYKDKGVVVLGIDLDRNEQTFQAAVAQYGLSYHQIYDGPDGPIASLYRISGIPMSYLIDQQRIIRGKGLRGEQLFQAIDALVNKN